MTSGIIKSLAIVVLLALIGLAVAISLSGSGTDSEYVPEKGTVESVVRSSSSLCMVMVKTDAGELRTVNQPNCIMFMRGDRVSIGMGGFLTEEY